ncbi:MAG: L,D-transpeptidase family protein [Proteobacteria bacterium]|nr:L,D-transpeptidase family protein [Pseudomonadota bacterium]
MAFLKPGILNEIGTPWSDVELKPTIVPDSDGETEWSTESRQETISLKAPARPQSFAQRRLPWQVLPRTPRRPLSLKARVAELAPLVTPRLVAKFEKAHAPWPPSEVALVAIKDERALELHARSGSGPWTLVHRYKVLAASGAAGPKLRQGDRQVPEGIYKIALLNPNSAYHVSLRVNYPNSFDRDMAAKDGRQDLGGDIMIHGKNLSAGCLAMGDEAAEELFVLAAQTGLSNVRIIIAPTDFRTNGVPPAGEGKPDWVPKLYTEIATAMADYKPAPKPSGLLSFFLH